MVMVLTIFGLLTAIVSYNYSTFNNQIILANLAYEVAMQVREAQVFSLGVRGSNGSFNSKYGVYFTTGSGGFISFIDGNDNNFCNNSNGTTICDNCASDSECEKVITMTRNMTISDIRVTTNEVNPINGTSLGSSGKIFISFQRPYTDSLIYDATGTEYSGVAIIIQSADGLKKAIVIRKTGQISVTNAS